MRHFLSRRSCLDAMDDSEERGVVAHVRRLPSASRCVTCCSSPAVRCQSPGSVNRCLPFAAWRLVRTILFGCCRLSLASRFCRSPLAASPWRLLLFVRVALSAAFCERSLFLLSPHAESTLRLLPSYVEPPQLPCGVNAFETHITLRCNMRVTFVKRCIHTLETLHSLPSPCGAAHRHALVATRPPRLELPGLGQWGK